MIMKQNIILLLLLMFSINIQAQSIKVSKTDKFTKDKVVYTSYEKISCLAFDFFSDCMLWLQNAAGKWILSFRYGRFRACFGTN